MYVQIVVIIQSYYDHDKSNICCMWRCGLNYCNAYVGVQNDGTYFTLLE